MKKSNSILTSREFSERVGVTPETVRRWVRSGKVKPFGRTPSGQLRFKESQVGEVLGTDELTERAQDIARHIMTARQKANMRRVS